MCKRHFQGGFDRPIATLLAALLGALGAADAAAQRANTEPSDQLAEIVITATKRESTVQTTPISITAVSGADIQARGLADFTALAQSVPGVSMKSSGSGQSEFEMRGMTSSGGNSPTVGFYLDDTPLTAPANAQNGKVVIDPNLYDLNHVEVLRGPQGTLYGSGSMGGTIKIVTNAPDPKVFDASAETIFSDTDGGGFNHGENAMLNLPMGSTAALRIVGSESHASGWVDRIVIANGDFPVQNGATRGNVLAAPIAAKYKGVNDQDLTSVRVSALWQPTDRLSMTPYIFYQRIQQNGLSDIDSNPGTNASYHPFNAPEPFSDRFDLGSLNFQYKFDAFDLTSTTSRWTRDEDLRQDGTEEVQFALSGIPGCPNPLPFYTTQPCGLGPNSPTSLEDDISKQTSEEVRLTSSGDTAFKWLVGYFYSDFESDYDIYAFFPGAASTFGTSNGFSQVQPTKILQNAFFTEVSYQLTSQLKATAGLRRYSYNTAVATSVSGFLSSTGSDTIANSRLGEHDQGVNPKLDISYELDKNLLLYATIAKGFRPGGANQPIPTSGPLGNTCEAELQANHGTTSFVPGPPGFAPDSVWSYEVGEKAAALDNRLTVNSAIYFEKWNGVQQNIPLGCGFPYTDNSGDAHIYGSEVEISTLLTTTLMLSANVGYTHATFVIGSLEAGITPGTPVQDVPDWTSSVSLAYRHSLSGKLALIARIENNYIAGHTDATYTINHLPSYDLTNLRMGVDSDRWSAVLFANNLFNDRALLSDASAINVNIPTFNRITVQQPLTVGIDLNYHFGR